MREHLLLLGDVQDIEVSMRQLEKEHGELLKADELKALFTRVSDLQKKLDGLEKDKERQSMQYNRAMALLEPLQMQKKQAETLLYGGTVHNEKEMNQIQTRIQQVQGQIALSETQAVEYMENLEAIQGEIDSHLEQLVETKEQLKVKRQENSAAILRLTNQIKELDDLRTGLRTTIDPMLIGVYDRIRMQKPSAIARLSGEICSGCRVGVPSHMIGKVREGTTLIHCETCGRILIPTE